MIDLDSIIDWNVKFLTIYHFFNYTKHMLENAYNVMWMVIIECFIISF